MSYKISESESVEINLFHCYSLSLFRPVCSTPPNKCSVVIFITIMLLAMIMVISELDPIVRISKYDGREYSCKA